MGGGPMSVSDILNMVEDWQDDELVNLNDQIVAMIKHKRDMRTLLKRNSFVEGDKVEWVNGRKKDKDYKKTMTGVITKMKVKKCIVAQDNSFTTWNIPYNMLTKRKAEGTNFNPITGEFE